VVVADDTFILWQYPHLVYCNATTFFVGIAAGGYTGFSWNGDGTHNVYIFELSTGKMLGKLNDIPNVITAIKFSPDGKFLSVAFRRGNQRDGIKVYSCANWHIVAEDLEYSGVIKSISFASDGSMATTSGDGYVRLYDSTFKLVARRTTPGGNIPFSVVFNPQGGEVAVSFDDSNQINILSSKNLAHLYNPDMSNLLRVRSVNSNVKHISWSHDGRFLYAGGSHASFVGKTKPDYLIRKWSEAGKGNYEDINASNGGEIQSVVALPNGEMLYCTDTPSFGIITKHSQAHEILKSSISNFTLLKDKFRVSADGTMFQFQYDVKDYALFSITTKNVSPVEGYDDRIFSPRKEFFQLSLTIDNSKAILNGTKLDL
jgi:WD40 repeat protein